MVKKHQPVVPALYYFSGQRTEPSAHVGPGAGYLLSKIAEAEQVTLLSAVSPRTLRVWSASRAITVPPSSKFVLVYLRDSIS